MRRITFTDSPSVEDLRALVADAQPLTVPESAELRRAIRVRAGLDMTTVARVLDVAPLTVSRWEREGRRPQDAHAAPYGRLLAVCREIAAPIDAALRKVA